MEAKKFVISNYPDYGLMICDENMGITVEKRAKITGQREESMITLIIKRLASEVIILREKLLKSEV